jgi:hypothetical protein
VPVDKGPSPQGPVLRPNTVSGSGFSPPGTNPSAHRPSRTIAATIRTWRSAAVPENSFS